MKKRLCYVLRISLILFLLFNLFTATVSVAWTEPDPSTMYNQAGDEGTINATQNVVGAIIQIIRIVGTGVAIIMLIYVGIKYMMAAPEEKAEFKKSATAYVVGAIVLFATTNIIGIISTFAKTNLTATT